MADVNANIGVNIDTSNALAQLKALQRQISQFHTSISKSSEAAALAQRDLQRNFINSVNSIGAFSAELRTVRTTAESFTDSLEKNKFSMREYFRYAGGATKTFGRLFKSEFDTINKVAEENVKRLQTQYIKMGRDASGAMRAIAIIPNELDMSNVSTQLQMAAQRQAVFNQLLKQGSTNLLNFGKNTQWAGRQLMVGFTLPLMALGAAASKTFMDMETAALKFRKVYGDLFTPEEERQQALADIQALGQSFTQYGIAVSQTVNLAADAAAAGFQGLDLQRQVTEATRLQVLGQIDQQKALETTISLQNAFRLSNDDLSDSINFLNAVENQTVVSLDDITTAIPKVAPVIMQLGGSVKDLAFFMTAMKQGGVNASEGANALKSGLAALINPTEKAAAMLAKMGINIREIVESNQGDLRATVIDFAKALDTLDPLTRARAIEQLFGKFQFARLSTLFENVTAGGTQAARVLELAGYSAEQLAATAESELGMTADTAMNKFRKTVEDLRFALVPVGQTFLEAMTPIVEFVGNIIEKFNNLPGGVKKAITLITVALGAIGPVALMTFGLIANGAANLIKGLMILRNGYLRLTGQSQILGEQTEFLTVQQQNALAVAHSLDQSHAKLVQTFTVEAGAVQKLSQAYERAIVAGANFSRLNPGMMRQPFLPGFKDGIISVPGTGNKDTVAAMLTPGEAVIPADMAKRYAPLIQGMIAGNIPGYRLGRTGSAAGTFTKTASDIKSMDKVALYKAPSAIKGQTTKINWSTLDAELQAIDDAVRSYLEQLGFSAEEINRKIGALQRKQASHISEQVQQIEVAGEVVDAKLWNADNLIADLGGINNYLNSIHKVTQSLSQTDIAEMAQNLNMSIDEFENELRQLQEGIHPTTRSGASVLGQVAKRGATSKDVSLAYQSRAAAAVMDVRLQGDFYETKEQRAYNPEKDLRALEQVERKVLNFREEITKAFNIGDEIAQISGLNVQSLQNMWNQLSVEAKARLLELKDDAGAFTQALFQEAQEAGIAGVQLGDAAIRGIAQGTQSQSNSRRAIKEGDNVVGGLEQGMFEGMDDVTLAGRNLGDAAIDGVNQGTGGGAGVRGPGIGFGGTAGGDGGAGGFGGSSRSLAKFNSALMGASFALTSVSGIASAFGGRFQGLSEVVFKISGVMFGLMSVVQLLTQEMFASVIANRANNIAAAMGAKSFKGLFANATGFGSKLLIAGKFLLKFAGPIGAVVAGLTTTYSIIRIVNREREKERQRIEAFSDVLKTTTDQMSFLGDYFDFIPKQTPLELFNDLEQVATVVRTAREQLKADPRFQEQFGQTIRQVRGMNDEQAQTALTLKGIELVSKGMSKEAVQTLIDSIKEEAGKTTLKFNFKDIEFDLPTFENLNILVGKSLEGFEVKFKKTFDEINTTVRSSAAAVQMSEKQISDAVSKMVAKELSSEIKNASAGVASFVNSLSGLVSSGQIDTETFKQAFGSMIDSIKANVADAGAQLSILQGVLTATNPKLAKLASGIKDVDKMSAVLAATAAGVSKELIKYAIAVFTLNDAIIANRNARVAAGLAADATADDAKAYADSVNETNRVLALLETEGSKAIEVFNKLNNAFKKGPGDGEKSAFQKAIEQLREQRQELANTNTAYNKLKRAGIETGKAFEIASDPILAAALATTKVGTTKWKLLISLIKDLNAELAKAELKKFFETRDAEVEFQRRFAAIIPSLQKLGIEAEDIREILSNPILAEEFIRDLKDGQVDSEKLRKFIEQIPELKKIDIMLDVKSAEDQFDEAFSKAMEAFEIQSKMAEAEYKPKIVDAEKEVKSAQDAVDAVQKDIRDLQRKIEADQRNIEMNFTRPIEDLQKGIEKLQRQIELQIDRPIEELNKQISKLQRDIEVQFDRPIADLQEQSSDLANDLTLIDKAAEGINAKYDAQEKALQQIADINQEIINQDKQRISIADALTRGDIAAAAQAAQEARAQAASAAAQRATGTLQAAREAEVAGLRGPVSGLTRAQIEERQFQIGQQIFALEERRDVIQAQILAKQDQIYNIELARPALLEQIRSKEDEIYVLERGREDAQRNIRLDEDKLYDLQNKALPLREKELADKQAALDKVKEELAKRLEAIDLEKAKWELSALALDAAKLQAGEYNKVLDAGKGLVGDIAKGWDAVTAAAKNAAAAIAAANAAAAAPVPSFTGSSVSRGTVTGTRTVDGRTIATSIENTKMDETAVRAATRKMFGGKIKKMAAGGIVPGRGMTDKVPALLTPGEFVVNKPAAKRFGSLLTSINESKYPSMLKGSMSGPSFVVSDNSSYITPVNVRNTSATNNSSTVYNYSVGITVGGTNSSPDSIAQAVMNEIRYVDSQRIKGQRAR